MSSHIQDLSDEHGYITEKDRDKQIFYPTEDVSQDLLMVVAVTADTYDHPVPIVDPDPPIPLWATLIYPDASGNMRGATSPALGGLFSPQNPKHAAAFSLPFPMDFLLPIKREWSGGGHHLHLGGPGAPYSPVSGPLQVCR